MAAPVHPRRLWARSLGPFRRSIDRVRGALVRRLGILHPRRIALAARWGWRAVDAARARRAEPRLTVAVDVSAFWEPLTGIGWYLFRLLEQLADRDDLMLRLYGPDLVETPDLEPPAVTLPAGRAIEHVRHPVPEDLRLPFFVRGLRFLRPLLVAADGNRILFAPNYFLPWWFRLARGRLVVTVHDLGFRRVPWTLREETRRDLARHLERTVARAVRVLTDSETVESELVESGLLDRSVLRTVHLGPGPVALEGAVGSPPSGTPERYALHVGTVEPRKGLPTLFEAWRRLREADPGAPALVLCGRFGWKSAELAEQVERASGEGWLHHFGYLPDAQVTALYRGATLVVLPTIYEGFGLPAVEAMFAGVPLLCSDIPVLREVAGDAALYAPPEDAGAWSDALTRMLADPGLCAALVARGVARRPRFDWGVAAERTANVWREAAEAGR